MLAMRDAIDGGDESDGDSTAHFLDVGEVLHDLDQAQNGADDPDGWRVTAGGLEYLGFLIGWCSAMVISSSMMSRILPVSMPSTARPEGFLEEGILNGGGLLFQRDDAVFAGRGGVFDDFFDHGVGTGRDGKKDRGQIASRRGSEPVRGVVIMTAPIVPPRTIMAEVI